jgi:hypothetical protein
MDMQVQGVLPGLQRTAEPVRVPLAQGSGIRMDWKGQSGNNQTVLGRAYVSILRDHGVALSALATEELLKKREADLVQIFRSFGFGEGQLDMQLVGTWRLTSTRSIRNESIYETDFSRAQLTSDSHERLTFYADGSWTWTEDRHMLVGAAGMWVENKEHNTDQGRWNAGDGLLYRVWPDESWSECQYAIQVGAGGTQLRLVCGSRGELWQRVD